MTLFYLLTVVLLWTTVEFELTTLLTVFKFKTFL